MASIVNVGPARVRQVNRADCQFGYGNWRSNMRVNAPHSVVTALAHSGKRRAAGRARYAQR